MILFSRYLIWNNLCYISKISNNYFYSYDDIYGDEFSFKDNILTVKTSYYNDVNVTKTFKKNYLKSIMFKWFISISKGIYNAKIKVF